MERTKSIYTASAGNFAHGLTAAATARGIAVRAYVPETAAPTKLAALRRLGAELLPCTRERWWEILSGVPPEGETGHFISPCADLAVIAGNATIGREIVEDLPGVEAIFVPFGVGGLVTGIALAAKRVNPRIKIIACEADCSTPLASAWTAGHPIRIKSQPSFITGIGCDFVIGPMWPVLQSVIDYVSVVTVREAKEAVRLLVNHSHVIAEGAGAVALAAAFRWEFGGNVVAVLSGGNIDRSVLAELLTGDLP